MEKSDACTSLSIKLRLSVDTQNIYHSTLVKQQYIGKKTKVVFLLLKINYLLLELNKLAFLYVFYKKNLIVVSLSQNMRILVSCRKICATNHVKVQLSVEILNG